MSKGKFSLVCAVISVCISCLFVFIGLSVNHYKSDEQSEIFIKREKLLLLSLRVSQAPATSGVWTGLKMPA